MREATLTAIQTARQLVRAVSEDRTAHVYKSTLEYAEAIVDLVGDTLHAHLALSLRPAQVVAALNHAARTFQSFTATDWRDMAQECMRQAESRTCVDCGGDVSPSIEASSKHWRCGDRWVCRERP